MIYAVCTPYGLDSCLQNMCFCVIAKERMRNDGVDVAGSGRLQQVGRLAQSSAGAGHVVNDNYGFIEEVVIRQSFSIRLSPCLSL